MDYQFKKFEGRNNKSESRITITKSNSIGFPQKYYQDNNIKDYKYVVFYFDKNNFAIGIHFTNNEEEKNKFSIIHSKIGYGGSVVARSFFKSCNIDSEIHHGRYEWKKESVEEIGDIYIVKLDNALLDNNI